MAFPQQLSATAKLEKANDPALRFVLMKRNTILSTTSQNLLNARV